MAHRPWPVILLPGGILPARPAYEALLGELGDEQRDAVVERTVAGLPADRAVEWLRALGESLQAPEKSKEKADVMHAIYDQITVAGPRSWVSG
ncbi:MAG: hypothetical protein V4515_10235 [Chloroflexota bacterium]